jgi:TetR/AcrR family transcriptional regulator, transcriptional repressor for nem operon
MARPSEFDRDEVLHRAMEVFWCQGYEATGMPDLVEAMGIGRQSLYNTFESKRGLFLEALRVYQGERAKSLNKVLDSAPSPLAGIETLLTSIATSTGVARMRGCLSVNTAAEIGVKDEEVAGILRQGAQRSKADIAAALAKAKQQQELPADLDEAAAADFVLTVMRGLRLSAKAGASVAETRNAVRMAMTALRHFHPES